MIPPYVCPFISREVNRGTLEALRLSNLTPAQIFSGKTGAVLVGILLPYLGLASGAMVAVLAMEHPMGWWHELPPALGSIALCAVYGVAWLLYFAPVKSARSDALVLAYFSGSFALLTLPFIAGHILRLPIFRGYDDWAFMAAQTSPILAHMLDTPLITRIAIFLPASVLLVWLAARRFRKHMEASAEWKPS